MQISNAHSVLERYGDPSLVVDQAVIKLAGRRTESGPEAIRALAGSGPEALILFLTGSRANVHEAVVASWMASSPGWAMFAPATHALAGRPRYTSPAHPDTYAAVHELRLAELDFCFDALSNHLDLNDLPVAVIGLSEGAVAALAWSPPRRIPRVCLAWSCEDTYFSALPGLPEDQTTPILNIVGGRDHYFGARGSIAAQDGWKVGHGAVALQDHPNSKVIIYPSIGHDLLAQTGVGRDVMSFLSEHLVTTKTNKTRETST